MAEEQRGFGKSALTLLLFLCLTLPAPAYDVHAPLYAVTYTDAQKDAQRTAGEDIIRRINAALAAGGHAFTVPPGIYRIPHPGEGDSKIALYKVRGFTLTLAHTEFILEKGSEFLYPVDCSDLAIIGPVRIDADPLPFSQGTVTAYDAATGLVTMQVMPGYRVDIASTGTLDAFSPRGVYLQNPSWAKYSEAQVLDKARGLVRFKTGSHDDIYNPGNLIAMRDGPNLLSLRDIHNFTLRDIDIYTGLGFAWGGGTGVWTFTHVRGVPRPGTNRLYGTGGCQLGNTGGTVTFAGCEFCDTTDDLIDYGGGGLFLCDRQESPRTVVTWGGALSAGDTVNFYDPGGFHPVASAVVTAVSGITDAAMQADAHRLVKTVVKARDGDDRPLHRVTLDRDIHVSPGDFVENGSGDRPERFTVRDCYFHDCAVRVMVQGFRHGLFENNHFVRISGGLALTCDAWWWEGPTCDDITVRGNVFQDTAFRNGWGTGSAALIIGPLWSAAKGDLSHGCAFHTATVTGNTFRDSSTGAIAISNTDHVLIRNNAIQHPFTLATPQGAISLTGLQDACVWDNTLSGCPGPGVAVMESHQVSILRNVFRDSFRNPANPPKGVPDAVIALMDCADTKVAHNKIDGTDSAQVIWVANSVDTTLAANHAAHLTNPGAAPVGVGTGNTGMHSDSPSSHH